MIDLKKIEIKNDVLIDDELDKVVFSYNYEVENYGELAMSTPDDISKEIDILIKVAKNHPDRKYLKTAPEDLKNEFIQKARNFWEEGEDNDPLFWEMLHLDGILTHSVYEGKRDEFADFALNKYIDYFKNSSDAADEIGTWNIDDCSFPEVVEEFEEWKKYPDYRVVNGLRADGTLTSLTLDRAINYYYEWKEKIRIALSKFKDPEQQKKIKGFEKEIDSWIAQTGKDYIKQKEIVRKLAEIESHMDSMYLLGLCVKLKAMNADDDLIKEFSSIFKSHREEHKELKNIDIEYIFKRIKGGK